MLRTLKLLIVALVALGLMATGDAFAKARPGSQRPRIARKYEKARRGKRKRKKKKNKHEHPAPVPAPEQADAIPVGPGGKTHVIFEVGASIKGQTTKAGEVRVLERRETELRSMVKRRTSFQREIIQTVFPDHT